MTPTPPLPRHSFATTGLPRHSFATAGLLFFLHIFPLHAQQPDNPLLKPAFSFTDMAPLPADIKGYSAGVSNGTILVAGGTDANDTPLASVLYYDFSNQSWLHAGELPQPRAFAASATTPDGLILIGGETAGEPSTSVIRISLSGNTAKIFPLPDLPFPIRQPVATAAAGGLYVAGQRPDPNGPGYIPVFLHLPVGGNLSFMQSLLTKVGFDFSIPNPQWTELPPWPGPLLHNAAMAWSYESLHLFGSTSANGTTQPAGYGYHPLNGWTSLSPPPGWTPDTTLASFGESHIFVFEDSDILAYHTLTNSWIRAATWAEKAATDARAVSLGSSICYISARTSTAITVLPPANNYGWIDHIIVAIYLFGMILMGTWFVRREKNTKDYFRAHNQAPWWAIGMSLFATGASAISLMTMPGKSFATNWTFFAISVYSVICLPISLFLLAPLIRKLNISTANEYLELRFGLTARMVGSIIYIVNQILGRMAPIIFLPSIAMAAITGIDIWIWILVVGTVTTIYTFLGGLLAVIWTDTIQGFIMLATVTGCLILILLKLDMPFAEAWSTLQEYDKLHTFDWGWDITQPMVIMVFTAIAFSTLSGIGDQNYVQRVQAAPTLLAAKKAVATQMAVAIPINILLFSLGTALYLYYRIHPAELNPAMKTDGVYPLFAAQHLPPGISGLVIAALLAASMSTISSAICSVANLGVDDFYRRFKKQVNERHALIIARLLSILVGILGIIGALFLAQSDTKSVWDAALIISGLITNGIVGFFALGLLTRRAHEVGALVGVIAGMAFTIYVQAFTPVTFWLYTAIGSTVTFTVGYLFSIIIPWPRKTIDGLTIYTLNKPRPTL